MLRTDDRQLLSEALAAPLGHELEILIGTTYSMQLSALLAIPLSLTFADWEQEDGTPVSEPVAGLEAVRRYAKRITVFCQPGATAIVEQPPLVAQWLEDVVVPVKAPRGGVFHAKVWAARYRNMDDGSPSYRMLCASRNLTFDRSWDTVLRLDGRPTPRGGICSKTAPLAEFIAQLPGIAVSSVTAARRKSIKALSEELRRVAFDPPEGCDDLRFHPLGTDGHTRNPFDTRRSRMLVLAPFIGAGCLDAFDTERPAQENILVSREEELDGIATAGLAHFADLRTLNDLGDLTDRSADDGRLVGLHAKLFVADAGWHAHLWTGSANATTAALTRNVEFLVRLDGRKSVVGIDAVLGNPQDPSALAHLLTDVPPRSEPVEPDPLKALERELDDLSHDLAEHSLTADIRSDETGFVVELAADRPVDLPSDVTLRCWPLTRAADRYPDAVTVNGPVIARFDGLSLTDLTAFFSFELRLRRDGHELFKAFLVRATLEGAPDGRREALMRELLKDPNEVLRLLRAMLDWRPDDEDSAGLGFILGLSLGGAGTDFEPPLLELLLDALAKSPACIDAVSSIIEDIRAAGDELLPPGLLEIWEPIAAVRRNQNKQAA